MGRVYLHFNIEKRRELLNLIESGKTVKEISTALGLHLSTIYREIERGTNPATKKYDPEYSENEYRDMLGNKGKIPCLEDDKAMAERISDFILNDGLSPEQAINKLQQEGYSQIPTKTTVYAAIDRGLIPGVTRENLQSKITSVFSDGMIHLPKWLREELNINDGDNLSIVIENGKIILDKAD